MKIKDYSIIETEYLNKLVDELENLILSDEMYIFPKAIGGLEIVKEIKLKLKPLIPIVENTFRQGERFARHDTREVETSEKNNVDDLLEYISNTTI
jgi:sporulation-control protein spo0M